MRKIDLNTWSRKEIYQHFSTLDFPFYAITLPIDVTNVKRVSKMNHISFYYLMVWACTKAINQIDAFNIRIRNKELVIIDQSHPSLTAMKKDTDIFNIITQLWIDDYLAFHQSIETQLSIQTSLFNENSLTDELIYFSCTPWFDFTALSNERNHDPDDMIPRISWGKYYQDNERLMVHLSLDVNHRTIDGIHIGKFKNALDNIISHL